VKALKVLGVVVVLALAGGGALLFFRDRLLAKAIGEGGTLAMGVPTAVADVDTSLGGLFRIEGLTVANPQGFGADSFLQLGTVSTKVPFGQLQADPLVIEELTVEGLVLRLERQNLKLNYQAILDNLKRLAGDPGAAAPEPEPSSGPARTVVLRKVVIENWQLHLDVGQPLVGPQSVQLGQLVLEDVQAAGEGSTEKAIGQLLDALLTEALTYAPGLPQELGPVLDALRGSLADGFQTSDLQTSLDAALVEARSLVEGAAAGLTEQARAEAERQLTERLGSAASEAAQDLAEQLGGDPEAAAEQAVQDAVEEAKKKAGEALGGLLGGKGKPPQ
jgi:hypothetical protein